MSKIKKNIRTTLVARLGAGVLAVVTFLFVAALFVMFRFSHQTIEEEAIEKAMHTLEGTSQHIDNILHEVEVANRQMLWNVEHHLDNPDVMAAYSRQIIKSNPHLLGCAISFEPHYYPEKGDFFSAYSYIDKNANNLVTTFDPTILQPGEYANVPYVGHNWFFIPKSVNGTCWVRPHVPSDTLLSNTITCSTPIHDKEGNFVGVLASDLEISKFSQPVLATKPFPNSYCAMLGVQGTYIIHPDSEKVYHRLISEVIKDEPEEVDSLVASMLAGESGYKAVHLFGQDSYVFYRPCNDKHWSICIVCPESDIFGANDRLISYMIILTICGLVLLSLFCVFFIRWQMKPLKQLKEWAKQIADGNFNTTIPLTQRSDEIGDLQNSLGTMQQSLAAHIEKMNQVSATLKERNEALQRVHEQVVEADRSKSVFLHNMTEQMQYPTQAIYTIVNTIREKQMTLGQEKIETLSKLMITHTKAITRLLDRILAMSQQKGSTLADILKEETDTY